jgi:hypothetical protein
MTDFLLRWMKKNGCPIDRETYCTRCRFGVILPRTPLAVLQSQHDYGRSDMHNHHRTGRVPNHGFQCLGVLARPLALPGEDDKVSQSVLCHTHDLRAWLAPLDMQVRSQLAARTLRREPLEELVGPTGPFVLRLVHIAWHRKRTALGSRADACSPNLNYE